MAEVVEDERGISTTYTVIPSSLYESQVAERAAMAEALRQVFDERDRARDIAARLEGEIAQVRDVVTAWSLGETSRDEMVLWAIREIVGLTPARPETPTPWPHFDGEVAP